MRHFRAESRPLVKQNEAEKRCVFLFFWQAIKLNLEVSLQGPTTLI